MIRTDSILKALDIDADRYPVLSVVGGGGKTSLIFRMMEELDADMLIILTAVEKVAVNFGKENEKWLDEMTVAEAQKYVDEGQFAPGSMLPKVQAAMDFASSGPERTAMITLLEKAKDGILGKTGTKIHM